MRGVSPYSSSSVARRTEGLFRRGGVTQHLPLSLGSAWSHRTPRDVNRRIFYTLRRKAAQHISTLAAAGRRVHETSTSVTV